VWPTAAQPCATSYHSVAERCRSPGLGSASLVPAPPPEAPGECRWQWPQVARYVGTTSDLGGGRDLGIGRDHPSLEIVDVRLG